MKKIIFLIMITVMCLYHIQAQDSNSIISLRAGIGGSAQGTKIKTPALYGSYEYFLSDEFSLGILAGYSTLTFTTTEFINGPKEVEEENSNIIVGALTNYYLVNDEAFNFYMGGSLGYASGLTGGFLYEVHAGASYWLSESFSLSSEIGVGLSLLKIGVSFKI